MSKGKIKPRTRILTGREARRYGERERQREQRKADAALFWRMSPEKRAQIKADVEAFQRIEKNGITLEDVRKAENESYSDGVKAGMESTIKSAYAAICLALREMYGFGKKRCSDVLNLVDEKITMALTSEEIIDEVWDTMGLKIEFKDMLGDRVTEKEDGA